MAANGDEKARYDALRHELIQAIPRKRALDKQLAQVELSIYNLEASYLTETAAHSGGNIIQGFDNYLKNQGTGRRKYEVAEQDRVFSNSSLTHLKSLELLGEGDDAGTPEDYSKQSTPGVIAIAPATRNQELTLAQQNKLLRDKEYQRRKRGNPSRKSAGDNSDDESAPSTSSRRPSKRAKLADDD